MLKALCDLLARLFLTNVGLRIFLRKLPHGARIDASIGGDHVPLAGLVDDAVQALQRHGLIDKALFDALIRECPLQHQAVREVARLFGVIDSLIDAPSGGSDEEPHCGSMLDNYLLQDVAHLLREGLPTATSARIDIDRAGDTHRYHPLPAAVVQLHSLFSFLTELVLRDRLWLDQDYASAWQQVSVGVDALADSKILRLRKMTLDWKNFKESRQVFLDEMCVTNSLRAQQAQAEQEFALLKRSTDTVHAIVFWGTAGNIARSDVLGLPYAPHPLRRHLLAQTSYAANDAHDEVLGWVQRERGRLFERVYAGRRRRTAHLTLPPIAALVIGEARDATQLIPVALQMREQFAPLREWLAIHQQALYLEDPDQLQQCSRFLDGLASALQDTPSQTEYGRTCVDLCTQLFPDSLADGRRLDAAIQLGQLIFAKKGETLLRRLLTRLDASPSQAQNILDNINALTPPITPL